MKRKKRILYSNEYSYLRNQAIAAIMDAYSDDQYKTEDEIPEDLISREMRLIDEIDWDAFSFEARRFFNNQRWIITGTVGTWQGPQPGGRIVSSFDEILNILSYLAEIEIVDDNGYLYITGWHHDGRNNYEIKKLTDRGIEYLDNWEHHRRWQSQTEEEMHNNIMSCNLFSALPRFWEKVYCSAAK